MRKTSVILFFFSLLTLFLVTSPCRTEALELTVSKVCSNPSVTTCFTSLRAAITAANPVGVRTGDTITIEPGIYTESVTLKDNLPISGIETARTVLKNPGAEPIINATGLSNVVISKLTIWSTGTGIFANNSAVDISNNVFTGSNIGTAIVLQGSSSGRTINNTFFQNSTAISSTISVIIQNNIFSTNGTALSAASGITFSSVNNNVFHNNTNSNVGFTLNPNSFDSTNIPNGNHPDFDPRFVNTTVAPPDMDLHLQEGSAAIGTGTPTGTDIGAYGGPNSDTIPFMISTPSVTATGSTISLSWSPNNSYLVNGYNVHYGTTSRTDPSFTAYNGTGATEGNSPISVPTTTATLSDLLFTAVTPTSPTLISVTPKNETALLVSWSTVSTATGYKVYFSTSSFDSSSLPSTFDFVEGRNTASHELTNLATSQTYSVAVSAVSQTEYFVAVTAFNDPAGPFEPGVDNESAFSDERSEQIGPMEESLISNILTGIPEAISPFPNLPNKGCFIATAAYGCYSAPQVKALRQFRDRYLLRNRMGRAFVEWYYRYGPIGADFINNHAWAKPLVRIGLMPAVGAAVFMTQTGLATKIIVILFIVFLTAYYIRKRKTTAGGGAR